MSKREKIYSDYCDNQGNLIRKVVWTEKLVKDQLPRIEVIDRKGVRYNASIVGRCLPFAKIHWGDNNEAEASWKTIAHCLNVDRPLQVV